MVTSAIATLTVGTYGLVVTLTVMDTNQSPYIITLNNLPYALLLGGVWLIAEHFGYKLSIHSGSDKFKVFPIIAKYTKGIFHVKTAGTNWLEAVRVISNTNPSLYRKMHVFALENFEEALKYYHVTPDLESITALDKVSDEQLSDYMNNDAARQLFHVTYGLILTAKDEKDEYVFRDEFFKTLDVYEEDYRAALVHHIGRHIELLGL